MKRFENKITLKQLALPFGVRKTHAQRQLTLIDETHAKFNYDVFLTSQL